MLLSLRSLFISNERQKGSELDGKGGREELEGLKGEETVIRIYYVRKDVEAQKCESISSLSDREFGDSSKLLTTCVATYPNSGCGYLVLLTLRWLIQVDPFHPDRWSGYANVLLLLLL